MYVLFYITIIVVIFHCGPAFSLNPEECGRKPTQRHCIIEYAARSRFPHTSRYFYDWATGKCILIRWSNHCDPPKDYVNNFISEPKCLYECSGWA